MLLSVDLLGSPLRWEGKKLLSRFATALPAMRFPETGTLRF